MPAGQSRRALFGAFSLVSVAAGVVGWLPLVLSAGLAMGNRSRVQVAIALAFAGLAACIGLFFGASALVRRSHVAVDITAAVGVCTSAVLGVVALVFALSFHW
jgi:hypothetical protein